MLAFRRSTAAFSFRRRAALSSGIFPDRQPAPGRRLVVATQAPQEHDSEGCRRTTQKEVAKKAKEDLKEDEAGDITRL